MGSRRRHRGGPVPITMSASLQGTAVPAGSCELRHLDQGAAMAEEREKASVAPVLVVRKLKQILESFTIEQPELTLQQITKLTGLPPSTCQRLVQNLVREGFLDRDEDRYRIGLGLVRVAAPGTFGLDLV